MNKEIRSRLLKLLKQMGHLLWMLPLLGILKVFRFICEELDKPLTIGRFILIVIGYNIGRWFASL